MNVIEISHLTRDYGGGKGVFDLSFSIAKGEVFGFLGPNGAGKTTTIRHLMGFSAPQQGVCKIGGLDCSTQTAKIQQSLGYIPGEISFIDDMTGIGFIQFMAAFRGLSDLTKAHELMEQFELDPKGKLRKMSKGMKQKIGIVCAFMHDPQVLVLDEPTSGLDPLMQNRFIDLILAEKTKGKTILMSSHMFEEVERTCDRVGIIRSGHLVAVDDVDSLKDSKQKSYQVFFRTIEAAAAFAREPLSILSQNQTCVTVSVKKDLGALIAAMSRHEVVGLDVVNQSLEEVFMHYYGGEKHEH